MEAARRQQQVCAFRECIQAAITDLQIAGTLLAEYDERVTPQRELATLVAAAEQFAECYGTDGSALLPKRAQQKSPLSDGMQ